MKTFKLIVAGLAFASLAMSASCNLDRYPFDAIERDGSFRTLKDATAFNNALYAQLRGKTYGGYSTTPDIQTDLFHAGIGYGNRGGLVYKWLFTDDDYSIRDHWAGYYEGLANVNNFLDNIDLVVAADDGEKAIIANLKGEAYFLRAFYFEKLVKRYARDYEPSTAAADPGIPLTLRFDTEEKPSRSTVAQVYARILDDLGKAESLMSTVGKPGSDRLTVDCVPALKAKVMLDMHRYDEAVAAANSLIDKGKYPLVGTVDELRKIWKEDAPDESILMLHASIDEPGNANNSFLGYVPAVKKYSPDYIPEQWLVDLYAGNDFRGKVYFSALPVSYPGVTGSHELVLLDKYPGNPALYSGTTSNYRHRQKIFRIAELHLVKAEALAWSGGREADALSALNVLRTARGLTALSGVSGDALKTEIKNERIRELLGEGNRLDDLKRWGEGIARGVPQNSVVVHGESVSLIRPAADPKFVWAIPSRELTTNPNLKGQQNPGW